MGQQLQADACFGIKMCRFPKIDDSSEESGSRGILMKADVLTLAVVIFLVGVLVSGLGLTDVFNENKMSEPSAALQQGLAKK